MIRACRVYAGAHDSPIFPRLMVPLRLFRATDPLVRLLIVAILLAAIFPVTGRQHEVAQGVSDAAVMLLFLLNGLRLPRGEAAKSIRHLQFLVPLVLWCFGAMALAGWGLSSIGGRVLPPELTLGLIYLGVMPSTVQSATAYSSVAGGNVTSSVIAAAVLNIAGVFICAPLFSVIAGGRLAGLDLHVLGRVLMLLVLPFVMGQILQNRLAGITRRFPSLIKWADRTAIAIAVYVAFSGAVEQGLWERIDGGVWAILLALVIALLGFAFGGAWLVSGAVGLDRRDRIAFFFAGGQKSIAFGAPMASALFPPAVAGMLLLPLLSYHLLQLVISAPLAARFSRRS